MRLHKPPISFRPALFRRTQFPPEQAAFVFRPLAAAAGVVARTLAAMALLARGARALKVRWPVVPILGRPEQSSTCMLAQAVAAVLRPVLGKPARRRLGLVETLVAAVDLQAEQALPQGAPVTRVAAVVAVLPALLGTPRTQFF